MKRADAIAPPTAPPTAPMRGVVSKMAGIADATPPARIRFAACRSHTGTARPLIPDDGEGVLRQHNLSPFALDAETVTNARFAAFVAESGYVTEAERIGWSPVFRGLLPPALADRAVATGALPWWVPVEGACWFMPEGSGSDVTGRAGHPVVQVSWADAKAFATWAGGRLPSEAEWEHAARGGLADPVFPWGDEQPDDTRIFCNIWQGRFPDLNTLADGYLGTAPARSFAANGAGLYNMAGNVWEWTADPWRFRSHSARARQRNQQALQEHHKVLKGGSFLCHSSYCYRYRIAARSALPPDSCTSNCGFRLAYDDTLLPIIR